MKRIPSACENTSRKQEKNIVVLRTELFLGHGFVLHRTVADRSELASDCSVLLVDVISLCLYGKAGVFLPRGVFPDCILPEVMNPLLRWHFLVRRVPLRL